LFKRGANNSAWKKRWFVLRGDELSYFDNKVCVFGWVFVCSVTIYAAWFWQGDKARKGVISITSTTEFGAALEEKDPHCLFIQTDDRRFQLRASTEHDMVDWLGTLKGGTAAAHTRLHERHGGDNDDDDEADDDDDFALGSTPDFTSGSLNNERRAGAATTTTSDLTVVAPRRVASESRVACENRAKPSVSDRQTVTRHSSLTERVPGKSSSTQFQLDDHVMHVCVCLLYWSNWVFFFFQDSPRERGSSMSTSARLKFTSAPVTTPMTLPPAAISAQENRSAEFQDLDWDTPFVFAFFFILYLLLN
jgi:hypothetical protein